MYSVIRVLALAINLVMLGVGVIAFRDKAFAPVLHPVVWLKILMRQPAETVYFAAFWAPLLAVVALFWSKRK